MKHDVYDNAHKSPPLGPTLIQLTPVYILTHYLSKIIFSTVADSRLGFSSALLPSSVLTTIFKACFIYSKHVACVSYILLHLINKEHFNEKISRESPLQEAWLSSVSCYILFIHFKYSPQHSDLNTVNINSSFFIKLLYFYSERSLTLVLQFPDASCSTYFIPLYSTNQYL